MNFSFDKVSAAPIRETKTLQGLSSFENKFLFFLEDLEKSGVENEKIEEIKTAGLYSEYFQDAFVKSKGLTDNLSLVNDLYNDFHKDSLNYINDKTISSIDELKMFLHKAVKKEMAKIAFRDILGKTPLKTTLSHLSILADTSVSKAVDFIHLDLSKLYGEPYGENGDHQKLIVIAMGKLGAYELNFSSDIDIIFVYPGIGETDGSRKITSEEFFIKLGQKFVSVFKGLVPGDDIFRVDLRLRPFGDAGPIVMSLKAIEHYYQTQGREWERYALIKARCITGYDNHIKAFEESIRSFIFRRYLDYGAFDSMREMKKKIIYEIKRKNNEKNIKNGSGGIREIEFFGQVFQLIRGGIDKRFREKGIIKILRLLGSDEFVPYEVIKGLEESYAFLRLSENRIQQLKGEQTHSIPESEKDIEKISLSLGFKDSNSFLTKLQKTRDYVHSHFMAILMDESDDNENDEMAYLKMLWQSPEENLEQSLEGLKEFKIQPPKEMIRLINNFKKETNSLRVPAETIERIDRLMPIVLKEIFNSDTSFDAANRVIGLISATIKKSCYISLLLENPGSVYHLVSLCRSSSWVGNYLKSHPVLLDELLDSRSLYSPPEKDEMSLILDSRISRIYSKDTERLLETICIFKQSMTLRVASAEISGQYPLMKISDRLTELAEVIIERVLQVAWIELVEKFGYPVNKSGETLLTPGIAVIAYGKLGGIELGYGSDLDLVFVHNDVKGITSGEKAISCVQFYSKLAQKVLSYLNLHTGAGKMYETDLRLRPGGSTGVVIVSVSAFADYFSSKAWTFEHQAFVKARIVCGYDEIVDSFNQMREKLLSKKREPATLSKEIREMRQKIVSTHGSGKKELFHLKYDEGGMMDIEFLAQYLVLLNSRSNKNLFIFTDTIRILSTLERERILKRDEASFLRFAYLVFRSMGHKLDLIEKKPVLNTGSFSSIRAGVRLIWNRHLDK